MEFEWDARKNDANIQKHGIDFMDAKNIFLDPHISKVWIVGQNIVRNVIVSLADGSDKMEGFEESGQELAELGRSKPATQGEALVALWEKSGVISSRPDIGDSQVHARSLRQEAELRADCYCCLTLTY